MRRRSHDGNSNAYSAFAETISKVNVQARVTKRYQHARRIGVVPPALCHVVENGDVQLTADICRHQYPLANCLMIVDEQRREEGSMRANVTPHAGCDVSADLNTRDRRFCPEPDAARRELYRASTDEDRYHYAMRRSGSPAGTPLA